MGRTFLSALSPNPFHTGFGEDAGRDSGCFSSMGLVWSLPLVKWLQNEFAEDLHYFQMMKW